MKTVVLETKGKHAVLLNSAGEFIRVKNKNYTIGQRLETPAWPYRFGKVAVAASVGAVLLLGTSVAGYCAPYTRVSMDVNPSIQLTLNYFNRIIHTTAVNEDGQMILANLNLFNDDLSTATQKIVGELTTQGYFSPGTEGDIMVTANSSDETRSEELLEDSFEAIENENEDRDLDITAYGETVTNEALVRAREYGVSPGKLKLVEQYARSTGDPASVNLEDWLDQPVKNIIKATKANGGMPPGAALGHIKNGKYNPGTTENTASPSPSATPSATVTDDPSATSMPDATATITPSATPGAFFGKADATAHSNNGNGNKNKDKAVSPAPTASPSPSPASGNNGNGKGNGNKS